MLLSPKDKESSCTRIPKRAPSLSPYSQKYIHHEKRKDANHRILSTENGKTRGKKGVMLQLYSQKNKNKQKQSQKRVYQFHHGGSVLPTTKKKIFHPIPTRTPRSPHSQTFQFPNVIHIPLSFHSNKTPYSPKVDSPQQFECPRFPRFPKNCPTPVL